MPKTPFGDDSFEPNSFHQPPLPPIAPFSSSDIEGFKTLMREECSVEPTDQDAWDRATELTNLYRMLLGPIPEDPEAPIESEKPQPKKQPPQDDTPPGRQLSLP